MGAFLGLDVAMSGLFTSQRAIGITNHNISNATTAGFSRQVATQQAANPIHAYNGTGMIGRGVEITSVNRVRNEYLDERYREKNTALGEWEEKSSALEYFEYIFNDNSDSDFNQITNDLFDAFQELSKTSEDEAVRTSVKQSAVSFCEYLNSMGQELQDQKFELNQQVQIKVMSVNSKIQQIADLSRQIYFEELDGSNVANDFRDRRDLLVDELSKIIDIETNEVTVGNVNGIQETKFQVTCNGLFLVNHDKAYELDTYEMDGSALPPEESHKDGMYGIKWRESGNDFEFNGGQLKGLIDSRDGNGTDGTYKGVQYYIDKVNEFAQKFARAINEGETASGEKLYLGHKDGVGNNGTTGINFFSYDEKSSSELDSNGYDIITASNISLSEEILMDVDNIAASTSGDELGNNEIMKNILELRQDGRIFEEGKPEDFFKSVVSNLGSDAQLANEFSSQEKSVVSLIDNQRMSISGVSLDEEMINIVRYQQTYAASAKMINVFNELLDVTINGII